MKNLLVSLMLLALAATPVLAQTAGETAAGASAEETQTESTSETEQAATTAEAMDSDLMPSERTRNNKSLLIGYAPFGLHITTLLTQPITVGYYINKNFLVGIEYGSLEVKETDFTGSYTNTGAYGRWFPNTNSFNVLFALHQRALTVDYSYKVDILGSPISVDSGMDYTGNIATVGISNQWSSSWGLVVGLDWLVYSSVLSSTFTFDDPALPGGITPDAKTRADIAKAEKEGKDLMDVVAGSPGLFILTVGFAF